MKKNIACRYMAPLLRFWREQSGVTAVVAAMMLPVMLGFAAMAVDASAWVMKQRELQTAADAAALAAAYEALNVGEDDAEDAGRAEAERNGLSAEGEIGIVIAQVGQDTIQATATLTDKAPLWFAQIFLESFEVSALAVAEARNVHAGSACILSLDHEADQALKASGTVNINMPLCGVAVNSSSPQAMYLNGTVFVGVSDVRIHGDYTTVGNVTFEYDSLRTKTARTPDPYADLEVPPYSPCSSNDKKKASKYTGSATLSPGVYCGGIDISGNNNITFEPGVYILDGGDFNVVGQGSLYGEGVSFVLTNSPGSGDYGKLNIGGGRDVNFSAPLEGDDMAGVVFYQDRNAPQNTKNSITGTSSITIDGTAYFPAAHIDYGGTSAAQGSAQNCSRIIGRTVTLHGTPDITNNCDGSAALTIRMPASNNVKLTR